jgi:hypothetical protein
MLLAATPAWGGTVAVEDAKMSGVSNQHYYPRVPMQGMHAATALPTSAQLLLEDASRGTTTCGLRVRGREE